MRVAEQSSTEQGSEHGDSAFEIDVVLRRWPGASASSIKLQRSSGSSSLSQACEADAGLLAGGQPPLSWSIVRCRGHRDAACLPSAVSLSEACQLGPAAGVRAYGEVATEERACALTSGSHTPAPVAEPEERER